MTLTLALIHGYITSVATSCKCDEHGESPHSYQVLIDMLHSRITIEIWWKIYNCVNNLQIIRIRVDPFRTYVSIKICTIHF